ncbi:MAG: serpin family protein [Planctomycetes bacterium]|nr:serpin family protein [Planctomycetota bacterium]
MPAPEPAKKLSAANNEFGFDLLRHLHKDGENTFLSPTSIGMALQMTSRGAKGETLSEMNETMHVGALEVGDANRKLLDALSGRDDVKLNVANAIWADPANLNLNKNFATDVSKQFDAEIDAISFSDPKTKDVINTWISDKTEQKIPEMLKELDPSIVALLANAIYFKGDWTYKFDKEKTEKADFTRADGSTQKVSMMQSGKLELRYAENDDVQIVALPYGPAAVKKEQPGPLSEVYMWLIVPKEGKSLDSIVSGLTSAEFQKLKNSATRIKGTVELPRFKMKYRKELQDDLPKLGMVQAFHNGKADFSGFESDNRRGLYISKVIHEAIIEVNEEGTVAAAATVVTMSKGAPPRSFSVRCDKPFLLAIADDHTGSIMFIGTVYQPEDLE